MSKVVPSSGVKTAKTSGPASDSGVISAPLYNFDCQKVGSCQLDARVFNAPVRADILTRVVNWQLAKRRAGTHKTKGISDVRGTTRKPYKQKGTGRARQGSLRSPQFRGGGIIFGPVVRSHAFSLPKKVRRFGLRAALSGKLAEEKLFVVDGVGDVSLKTRDLKGCVKKFARRVLFVVSEEERSQLKRGVANLVGIDVLPVEGANVYDIMRHEAVVLGKNVVSQLEERAR
jgi:large subunit ribosomal protein L4